MARTKNYESYRYLSEKTRITEEWLKTNLPAEINTMFPGDRNIVLKGGERLVYLKNFKEWMKRSKLLPLPSMARHLGFSQGQINGIRKRHPGVLDAFLVPTRAQTDYIREHMIPQFERWMMERKKANQRVYPPGVCPKPGYVVWPENGKTVVIPRIATPKGLNRLMVPAQPPSPPPPKVCGDPVVTIRDEDLPEPLEEVEREPEPERKAGLGVADVQVATELQEILDRLGRPKVIRFTMPYGIKLEMEFEDQCG